MNIKKVSDITEENIANYIKLAQPSTIELKELKTFLEISKNFIKSYTGIENLDKYVDFIVVVYVLCQDLYDNRSYYVDKNNLNKVVETILNMHSTNLL